MLHQKKEVANQKKMKEDNQNKSFDEIYHEIFESLKGNLTNKEYRELITLEYVLTWGYQNIGEEERYKELRLKKDERA